jgi:hypothetical protein
MDHHSTEAESRIQSSSTSVPSPKAGTLMPPYSVSPYTFLITVLQSLGALKMTSILTHMRYGPVSLRSRENTFPFQIEWI